MKAELLRKLPLFSSLSEADLEWLAAQAQPITMEAGEMLIKEGDPGDAAYVVIDGEFEIIKKSDQRDIVIALREPGAVIGEMALLDQSPRNASVRAVKASQLLKISDAVFFQLLDRSSAAVRAILQTVSGRLQQNEGMLRQSEKMAALGTLSAGLAHELNNPAAAARRSADQLRASLEEWQKVTAEVNRLGLDGRRAEILDGLRRELAEGRPQGGQLSLLEQSEAESELQTWLEAHSIPDAWELAPTLVAAGWNAQRLTDLSRSFSEAEMGTTVRWLATVSGAYALLGEVSTATERISEIVRSVKEYAYLDQAPVQQVDVKRGLENTLVILRHKMKEGGAVEREYAPNLPLIEAYGSELNQVWTNLLDNAIDATEGKGHLVVRTRSEPNQIVVEIQDDGPGIAPAVQKRIFEPFFTTKPPGVGTGLGLHIAYTIVHKHYGRINVTSQPGKTCFAVQLPVCLPRAKG